MSNNIDNIDSEASAISTMKNKSGDLKNKPTIWLTLRYNMTPKWHCGIQHPDIDPKTDKQTDHQIRLLKNGEWEESKTHCSCCDEHDEQVMSKGVRCIFCDSVFCKICASRGVEYEFIEPVSDMEELNDDEEDGHRIGGTNDEVRKKLKKKPVPKYEFHGEGCEVHHIDKFGNEQRGIFYEEVCGTR